MHRKSTRFFFLSIQLVHYGQNSVFLENEDWLRHRRGTVPDQDSPRRCLSPFFNFGLGFPLTPHDSLALFGSGYARSGRFEL